MTRFPVFSTVLATAIVAPATAWAQDKPEIVENSIGMKFARIPEGTFLMGSPLTEPERAPNESPHQVSITQPFYMGVHEVTQGQYSQVMMESRAVFNSERGGGPDHPMENVEWQNAVDFCKALSKLPAESRAGRRYRLPTEAEWEYACRAGANTAFHTGDSLSSEQANFDGRNPYGDGKPGPYQRRTVPVGSYQPNAFGLYDMHGNVAEFCADFYDPGYYESSPSEDPPGPPMGVVPTDFGDYHRVVRGGSWLDEARGCRCAYRFRAMPGTRYRIIGFRVVCEISKERK